jgi:hypothetical protein
MIKNILVWTKCKFDFTCGGLVVQYELCRILKSIDINVKIVGVNNIKNSIFNDYYDNSFDLNETVVIYGETIEGNPLNAPYVVRWILAPLGICSDVNICNTWGKNDLVYYFNSEEKIKNNIEKFGSIYKLLNIMYINPYAQIYNKNSRGGICYTIRKGLEYHKTLKMVHPSKSFEIKKQTSQTDCIKIFNKYKCFVCYDPCTFLQIIACLCGCITIVIKVDGVNKQEWLNTTACVEYLKETGEQLYGVAYGIEEIEFSKSTLHLVKEQWVNINNFFKKKYVDSFVSDINNFRSQINKVENNFY